MNFLIPKSLKSKVYDTGLQRNRECKIEVCGKTGKTLIYILSNQNICRKLYLLSEKCILPERVQKYHGELQKYSLRHLVLENKFQRGSRNSAYMR